MALGLAAATITGGLLIQPQRTDQDMSATPAPLSTERVTPRTTPSPSSPGGAEAAITPEPSATSGETSPTAASTAGTPTSTQSASESSHPEQTPVSRSSDERSPLDDPSSEEASPSESAPTQQPPENSSGHSRSDAEINGWNIDYFEGFDASSLESAGWGHYGWGEPDVGHGAMGVMSNENTFVQNGELVVRTQYKDGRWSAGGASSADSFSASRGRWEVRAKFPKAKGIGYVFLLWPQDQSWPPEIDFAEGRVNGPEVMGTYHWDSDDKQDHQFVNHEDMTGWHTYGAIVEQDHIIFTLDGKEWGRINQPNITDKQMWFGVQTGAMDPNGKENHTETVDGGVPNPLTPPISDIQIDYVAHYTKG